MPQTYRKLFLKAILLGLTLLLAASFPAPLLASVPGETSAPATATVDEFAAQLMLALVDRNYTQLQQMMGDPFAIGYWQSEGVSVSPGQAIAQLRDNYLMQPISIAFNTTQDLTALFDGTDPLTMWGPDVNAVKAIYVVGLGASGEDEAILVIAEDAGGEPYWHAMLVAAGGFARPSETPTATPTVPAGVSPTTVRYIQILQTVNVRGGPGTQYPRIGSALRGAVVEVFGVNDDGNWWNVLCPNNTVGNCWISAAANLTRPTSAPSATPTTPPASGAPTRIQFQQGATSATVRGNVQFPNRPQYVLRALAGQVMTVEIFSPTGAANFAVQGVSDGQPYKRVENEDRFITFTLPRTQDYLITVAIAGGATAYELRITIVTPGAPPPSAPVRIQFAPGAIAATVNGMVTFPQQPQYVLRALAGQQMTVQINSAGNQANFAITGVSDGQPYKRLVNEDRTFTFTLPRTQDYRITVGVPGGSANYSLTVTVVGASSPPPAQPERIRFAPGAISATVFGNVPANGRRDYILGARAGQTMWVELNSSSGALLLAITGADGTPYKRSSVGGPSFSFVLPTTQDYLISAVSAGGGANFSLTVTIQ
jgi:hypothetical protein